VSPRRENEEPLAPVHLERRPPLRHDGRRHSDVEGAVAHEPPQVRVFHLRVGDQQHQVGGAVFGDDALGGRPVADAAVLQNRNVSGDAAEGCQPVCGSERGVVVRAARRAWLGMLATRLWVQLW
jgi:hypothetical protein